MALRPLRRLRRHDPWIRPPPASDRLLPRKEAWILAGIVTDASEASALRTARRISAVAARVRSVVHPSFSHLPLQCRSSRRSPAVDRAFPSVVMPNGICAGSTRSLAPIRAGYTQMLPPRSESQIRMQVSVRDNNVDQALRVLKKKLQREGVYRELRLRRHFEKPSEKRARQHAAAVSRARKADRKRAEKDQ